MGVCCFISEQSGKDNLIIPSNRVSNLLDSNITYVIVSSDIEMLDVDLKMDVSLDSELDSVSLCLDDSSLDNIAFRTL